MSDKKRFAMWCAFFTVGTPALIGLGWVCETYPSLKLAIGIPLGVVTFALVVGTAALVMMHLTGGFNDG